MPRLKMKKNAHSRTFIQFVTQKSCGLKMAFLGADKGTSIPHSEAVLSFIYQGGTQLDQEDLPSFLGVAADLKIEGLTMQEQNIETDDKETTCNVVWADF